MFENYLNIETIPVGDILKRILLKLDLPQRQLAVKANELPQRINDVIAGRRRITIEQSLKLEKALNISIDGFFYKIQANHDIYLATLNDRLANRPDIKQFRKSLFWDIDINKLNWTENRRWVVQRIFEYGNDREIKAVINFYGASQVFETLTEIKNKWNHTRRIDNIANYLKKECSCG